MTGLQDCRAFCSGGVNIVCVLDAKLDRAAVEDTGEYLQIPINPILIHGFRGYLLCPREEEISVKKPHHDAAAQKRDCVEIPAVELIMECSATFGGDFNKIRITCEGFCGIYYLKNTLGNQTPTQLINSNSALRTSSLR